MKDRESTWVALMTVGMGFVVVGLLLLDATVWFAQYAVLGVGVLLSTGAVYQATR